MNVFVVVVVVVEGLVAVDDKVAVIVVVTVLITKSSQLFYSILPFSEKIGFANRSRCHWSPANHEGIQHRHQSNFPRSQIVFKSKFRKKNYEVDLII